MTWPTLVVVLVELGPEGWFELENGSADSPNVLDSVRLLQPVARHSPDWTILESQHHRVFKIRVVTYSS